MIVEEVENSRGVEVSWGVGSKRLVWGVEDIRGEEDIRGSRG